MYALTVYTGGAVDYDHLNRTHIWRHELELRAPSWHWYCPICANADKPDDATVMLRNDKALTRADRAIFVLDGSFTVGTPIEINQKVRQGAWSVCIVHAASRDPGLFVRWWMAQGATVVYNLDEALAWLAASRT